MASTIKVDNVQNQPGTNVVNKCGTTVNIGAASDNIRSAGNNLQASDGGNLISQSGTDITLGASGDTINLASGASQSGFGRTGTVDWVTTPKVTGDSPVTGATGSGYFLNTTAGTITLNLPAGAAGSIVSMADYAETWATNNVTVAPNGAEKIGGTAANATLNTKGQSVTFVYVDSTQGWVNTMDSTSNVRGAAFITATGGTPCAGATCGDYKIHTFTGPGTFCVAGVSNTPANNEVAYLVVAGGGGGGANHGGGAGAGGFREGTNPSIVPYTASPAAAGSGITVTATGYPIVIGAGAPANPACQQGISGSDSSFSTITSTGGGGGGGSSLPGAEDGGSGGGSAGENSTPGVGSGNTPPFSPPQGQDGGSHTPTRGPSAGGGGALCAGTPAPGAMTGGAGSLTEINPSPSYGTPGPSPTGRYFAGGGGGASYPKSPGTPGNGAGGVGGGASGNGGIPCSTGNAGTVNTGGGGGGVYAGPTAQGPGGSGIVIIRYKFQ